MVGMKQARAGLAQWLLGVGAGAPASSALQGAARTVLGEHSARRGQLQLAARLLRGKITPHFPAGGCEETT